MSESFDLVLKISKLAATQTRTENIYQVPEGWIIQYPEFAKLADTQMHTFWPWDEPEVENDIQDLRVHCSLSERHGILEGLKLFTHYEMKAGDDYWSGRIMNTFKRPEIQRMASMFSAVEFNSHAPFYNKINEVLFVDTPEFYSAWKQDPVLSERMSFIGEIINSEDDLVSIGGFTFIEGAVLYSTFSYLKHYQAQDCGKDLIKNVCRGINQSVADENTHAVGGAGLFRAILEERKLSPELYEILVDIMREVALSVYKHESHIVDILFSQGDIKGITSDNMKSFVKHRINLCLANLGMPLLFEKDEMDGFIESWFYKNINSIQFHDFFSGSGSEYNIKWKEERFGKVWE